MKKSLAVFLAIILLLASLPLAVFAQDTTLKIDVVSDMHFSAADSSSPIVGSTPEQPFGHVINNGKMVYESKAIITKMLSQMANDDSEYLIITGDISDTGKAVDMAAISAILKDFEATSGKTVLASIGNHETYGGNVAAFKQYYADLGYDKAIAVDEKSASYVAELNEEYRLIQIDVNGFNDERYTWLEEQVKAAKEDGKKLITTSHYNLFDHFTIQKLAEGAGGIDSKYNLADKFIEWGIRFNFSGHTHALDTTVYENDNGFVYDMISGTPTTYPCCYRRVTFTPEEVQVNTAYIRQIDTELVPTGLSEEAYNLMKTDFTAYSKTMFMEGSAKNFRYYLSASYLKTILQLNAETDGEIMELLDIVMPEIYDALYHPLYGEESLAEYAEANGFAISSSDYKRGIDVLCEVYAANCAGNENVPTYSTLGNLLTQVLNATVYYALEPLTEEQYKTLIKWGVQKLNVSIEIPDNIMDTLTSALGNDSDVKSMLITLLAPLINEFSQDVAPDDVRCTLPGYGSQQQESRTFFERLLDYLHKFLSYFTILGALLDKLLPIFSAM